MGKIPVICLRVDSNIIIKEITKIISRLLNNTVLRLDGIPNEALKAYRLFIAP